MAVVLIQKTKKVICFVFPLAKKGIKKFLSCFFKLEGGLDGREHGEVRRESDASEDDDMTTDFSSEEYESASGGEFTSEDVSISTDSSNIDEVVVSLKDRDFYNDDERKGFFAFIKGLIPCLRRQE